MDKLLFYLTIDWNDLTIDWNDLTIDWNDLTWNDLTMERNDRKSKARDITNLQQSRFVNIQQSRSLI